MSGNGAGMGMSILMWSTVMNGEGALYYIEIYHCVDMNGDYIYNAVNCGEVL